ncbi:MAG: hypothetical protein AB2L24_09755, partial [Mangrovibacterium sp.]
MKGHTIIEFAGKQTGVCGTFIVWGAMGDRKLKVLHRFHIHMSLVIAQENKPAVIFCTDSNPD